MKELNKDLQGIDFLRNAVNYFDCRCEFFNQDKNPIQLLKEYYNFINE